MKYIVVTKPVATALLLTMILFNVACHKGEKITLAGMVTEVGSYPYSGCTPDYLLNAGTCNYPVKGKGLSKYLDQMVTVVAYNDDGCVTVTKVSKWEDQ